MVWCQRFHKMITCFCPPHPWKVVPPMGNRPPIIFSRLLLCQLPLNIQPNKLFLSFSRSQGKLWGVCHFIFTHEAASTIRRRRGISPPQIRRWPDLALDCARRPLPSPVNPPLSLSCRLRGLKHYALARLVLFVMVTAERSNSINSFLSNAIWSICNANGHHGYFRWAVCVFIIFLFFDFDIFFLYILQKFVPKRCHNIISFYVHFGCFHFPEWIKAFLIFFWLLNCVFPNIFIFWIWIIICWIDYLFAIDSSSISHKSIVSVRK